MAFDETSTEFILEIPERESLEEFGNAAEIGVIGGNMYHLKVAAEAAGLQRSYGDSQFKFLAERVGRSERWVRSMAQVGRVFEDHTVYPQKEISVYTLIAAAKERNEIADAQEWLDRAVDEELKVKQLRALLNGEEVIPVSSDEGKISVDVRVNKRMVEIWYSFMHSYGHINAPGQPLPEGKQLELHHVQAINSYKTGLPLRRRYGLNTYAVIPIFSDEHRPGKKGAAHENEDQWIIDTFGSKEKMYKELLRISYLFINEKANEAIASIQSHAEAWTENTEIEGVEV